jgi:hypothetical protein
VFGDVTRGIHETKAYPQMPQIFADKEKAISVFWKKSAFICVICGLTIQLRGYFQPVVILSWNIEQETLFLVGPQQEMRGRRKHTLDCRKLL